MLQNRGAVLDKEKKSVNSDKVSQTSVDTLKKDVKKLEHATLLAIENFEEELSKYSHSGDFEQESIELFSIDNFSDNSFTKKLSDSIKKIY